MRLWIVTWLAAWLSVTVGSSTGLAQTLPPAPSPQAGPQPPSSITIAPIRPASVPTSGLPANILTPSTTTQLEPNTGTQGRSAAGGVGRGLPGMPGGPPLISPPGAQDPSVDYMRPPAIGPLFCDPAVNISC